MAALLCVIAGCNAQKKQPENMNDKKMLVVYFSHTGENYSVGNIKVGNTKIVADYISELTGADQFEVVTHKYDGMSYKAVCDMAQDEQAADMRPEFEGKIDDISQYDVIFIGTPIWWGTYPQVMFTFFDTYDLNGKKLIPFATHEGSGLGNTVSDLRKAYPKATVTGSFSIYGHDVRDGKSKVQKWIDGLNL